MNRVNGILAGALGVLAAAWILDRFSDGGVDENGIEVWTIHDVPLLGDAVGLVDDVIGAYSNPDLQGMRASPALCDMLKKSESLLLTRTRRPGEAGWTIGWGRYELREDALPATVTRYEADAMFAVDIEARAARWVRAYVTVPLSQEQFDACCSMAYNLKPSSFRTVADAINRGEGPEAAAMKYLGGPLDRRGVTNRRNREFALFNQGVYS